MTEDQRLDRTEREGMLIFDAGMTVHEAVTHCNRFSDIYGFVEIEEQEEP